MQDRIKIAIRKAVSKAHLTHCQWETFQAAWLILIQDPKSLDAYRGSQWTMPPVFSVFLRRQHVVEMHDIIMTANGGLPEYLSILHDGGDSLFSEKEFRFPDPRLSGLVLEPDAR